MVNTHMEYLIPLEGMKFTEGENGTATSTFQAFPIGVYKHPVYGEINFDQTKNTEMASNVNNKVRGQDLDIDYNHKSHGAEAAGWVKAAEARQDGLWLTVDWTKTAYKKIREKAFRYFSPEFDWKWKHPQTGVVHKNVLFGGGITNRPFLKNILPINLSEFIDDSDIQLEEGNGMDPKLQRKLLGLPADATDDQVTEALAKLPDDAVISSPQAPPEEPPKVKGTGSAADDKVEPIAASETSAQEVIRLAEASDDPAIKALAELAGGLVKKVASQGAALALAEAHATVLKLSQPNEGKMLSAGAGKLLEEALLDPSRENVMAFAEGMLKGGIVKSGEAEVREREAGEDGKEAQKRFNDAVDVKLKADKDLQYADAVELVAAENPTLFSEYQEASYSWKEA